MTTTTATAPNANEPLTGRVRTMRIQLIMATWLSYAGFYCTRKVISVVKGPLRDALHTDNLGVSNLLTTYLVTYTIGQFTAAWLSQRMSNRTQLMLGMSVSIVCNLAMGGLLAAHVTDLLPYMIVMGIHGIAQATGWPCNIGIMAAWTRKKERGRLMAIWATSYQLGSVIAKALASFLFGFAGIIWSFWGSSIALTAVVLFFYFFGKNNPQSVGLPAFVDEEKVKEVKPSDSAKATTREEDDKADNRRQLGLVLAMGLIYFAFKFLRYALDSWSVVIITQRFPIKTEHAGYLSTTFDWVGFLGVLFAGWLSDRLGSRLRVIFFMTLGLVCAAALLWGVGMSSVPAFGVILGIVGFMSMGPDSLLSGAAAMDTGSQKRAAVAAGIINGCGSIGPIVQEPLIGWLMKNNKGTSAIMGLLFGVTVAAAIGVTIFQMRIKRLGIRL